MSDLAYNNLSHDHIVPGNLQRMLIYALCLVVLGVVVYMMTKWTLHSKKTPKFSNATYATRRTYKLLVSLASYRDVRVVDTLRDLHSTARHPDGVVYAVFLQCSEEERGAFVAPDGAHVRVLHEDSTIHSARGPYNARQHLLHSLHHGEPYILQLDCHMRSCVIRWDVNLINELEAYALPAVMSTYPVAVCTPQPTHTDISGFEEVTSNAQFPRQKSAIVPHRVRRPRLLLSAAFLLFPSSLLDVLFPRSASYPQLFHGEEMFMAYRLHENGVNVYRPSTAFFSHAYDEDNGISQKKFVLDADMTFKAERSLLLDTGACSDSPSRFWSVVDRNAFAAWC